MNGTTKLAVCNGAILLLGEEPVAAIDDLPSKTAGNYILQKYDEIVALAMRAYNWAWMTATQELGDADVLRDESPYDILWVVYRKPTNMIGITRVLLAWGQNQEVQFRVDNDGIHTRRFSGVVLVYLRALPESQWQVEFSRYVQAALAAEAAGKIRPERQNALMGEAHQRLVNARTIDMKRTRGNSIQAFDANGIIRARDSRYFGDAYDGISLAGALELGHRR